MKALAKVLLVDDEREFVAILSRRLSKRGYAVGCALSGNDALVQLEKDKDIEVVVLDVKMPGLDGIEILKLIKAKRPLVEVIMLTGHSTLNSAINAIKLGACDFLLKPVAIEQLVLKMERAAECKRRRDNQILEVYMKPYITQREREKLIADILNSRSNSNEIKEI